jgi:hypothetical protein
VGVEGFPTTTEVPHTRLPPMYRVIVRALTEMMILTLTWARRTFSAEIQAARSFGRFPILTSNHFVPSLSVRRSTMKPLASPDRVAAKTFPLMGPAGEEWVLTFQKRG